MSESVQKITVQLIKLGIAVALSQIANNSVREIGSDTIGEISKSIRRLRSAYQERRQAA